MNAIASFLNGLFDLVLSPFGGAPKVGLVVLAGLMGVVMLLLFKTVTRQETLAARRRVLTGRLYELGLFQDDLKVMGRIQWDLLKANGRYLAATLPALVVLLPVALIVLMQVDARFQRRGLRTGETMLVTAGVAPTAASALDSLRLTPGEGLALDAGPVRDREANEVWWRVRAERNNPLTLAVTDGAREQELAIGKPHPLSRLAIGREHSGWHRTLLDPGAPALPRDGALRFLKAELPADGAQPLHLPWWLWTFFATSICVGLVVKGVFKVEI